MRSIHLPRLLDEMRSRAWRRQVATFLAVTFAGSLALAQETAPVATAEIGNENLAEARRRSSEGLEHYEAERYPEAIAAFEAAYALVPIPLLLYNLGQAHRLQGDCAQATQFYERFAKTGPTGAVAEFAQARLVELQACHADEQHAPVAAPGAEESTGEAPVVPRAAPGADRAEAHSSSSTRSWSAALHPRPASDRTGGERSSTKKSHLLPALLGGGAAVLLTAGSFFAWRSHEASGEVSRRFEDGGTWDARGEAAQRRGQLYENLSMMALAGGGLLGGAGVCVWIFD